MMILYSRLPFFPESLSSTLIIIFIIIYITNYFTYQIKLQHTFYCVYYICSGLFGLSFNSLFPVIGGGGSLLIRYSKGGN